MKMFRLKNSMYSTWHISFERGYSRDFSLCGNAKLLSEIESDAIDEKKLVVEEFKDTGRLCPSCVLKAYQLGLICVRKVE